MKKTLKETFREIFQEKHPTAFILGHYDEIFPKLIQAVQEYNKEVRAGKYGDKYDNHIIEEIRQRQEELLG